MPGSDHVYHEDPMGDGSYKEEDEGEEANGAQIYGWTRRHFIEWDRLVLRTLEGFLERHAWRLKDKELLNRLRYSADPKRDLRTLVSEKAYATLGFVIESVQQKAGVPEPLRTHVLDFAEAYFTGWRRGRFQDNARHRSQPDRRTLAVRALIRILRTKQKEEYRIHVRRLLSCADSRDPALIELFSQEELRELSAQLHGPRPDEEDASVDTSGLGHVFEEARYRVLSTQKDFRLIALLEWAYQEK